MIICHVEPTDDISLRGEWALWVGRKLPLFFLCCLYATASASRTSLVMFRRLKPGVYNNMWNQFLMRIPAVAV